MLVAEMIIKPLPIITVRVTHPARGTMTVPMTVPVTAGVTTRGTALLLYRRLHQSTHHSGSRTLYFPG